MGDKTMARTPSTARENQFSTTWNVHERRAQEKRSSSCSTSYAKQQFVAVLPVIAKYSSVNIHAHLLAPIMPIMMCAVCNESQSWWAKKIWLWAIKHGYNCVCVTNIRIAFDILTRWLCYILHNMHEKDVLSSVRLLWNWCTIYINQFTR